MHCLICLIVSLRISAQIISMSLSSSGSSRSSNISERTAKGNHHTRRRMFSEGDRGDVFAVERTQSRRIVQTHGSWPEGRWETHGVWLQATWESGTADSTSHAAAIATATAEQATGENERMHAASWCSGRNHGKAPQGGSISDSEDSSEAAASNTQPMRQFDGGLPRPDGYGGTQCLCPRVTAVAEETPLAAEAVVPLAAAQPQILIAAMKASQHTALSKGRVIGPLFHWS